MAPHRLIHIGVIVVVNDLRHIEADLEDLSLEAVQESSILPIVQGKPSLLLFALNSESKRVSTRQGSKSKHSRLREKLGPGAYKLKWVHLKIDAR